MNTNTSVHSTLRRCSDMASGRPPWVKPELRTALARRIGTLILLAFITSAANSLAQTGAQSRNVSLAGSLQLEPINVGAHADVAAHKNLVFVGKWRCPGLGVDIIDISDPANPVKIANTENYVGTSTKDMQAIRIGHRDVLAIGLQQCALGGKNGLALVDITDPFHPQPLSFFETGAGGVHEFDLVMQGNRALAPLAVPFLEALTALPPDFADGVGDLLIVDITDPVNPTVLGEWGVLAEPTLGLQFFLEDAPHGTDPRVFLHSVCANRNGTRAYLSYWDAGFIILDISDPTSPVFLGKPDYGPEDEGNAHSVAEARGGRILVGADENFHPSRLSLTSSAFPEARPLTEAVFTPPISSLPGQTMSGEVVHIGRGCPDDPYLADPAGKIALIQRGACRFDNKIARAQLAGAIGVIVYGFDDEETLTLMGGESPVVSGDPPVIGTDINIPAVFVQHSTGVLLRDGVPPVTATVHFEFQGWGYLRIFDISDPAHPIQISTFATENTFNEAVANEGIWSVHNPEVRGNKMYASWYSDGVRVIDISRPDTPREIGFWTGEGAPADAPPVDIWSVIPHHKLLIASDRNYDLYILKEDP